MPIVDFPADTYGFYVSDNETNVHRKDSVVSVLAYFQLKLFVNCHSSCTFIASRVKIPTIINLIYGVISFISCYLLDR